MDEDNDRLLAVKEVWIDPNFSNDTRQVCMFVFSVCVHIAVMDLGHVMIGINLSAIKLNVIYSRKQKLTAEYMR